MADEYQVTRPRTQAIDGPPRPRRAPEFPEDPDAARAEIEATRARMSDTIDEIEDVLLRKKEKIRDQMDVMAPVREEPVKTIAMIFGAALALGLLTGGGKKSHADRFRHREVDLGHEDEEEVVAYVEDEDEEDEAALAWERAEAWEDRAHRLLRIAKAQEAELDIHRSQRDLLRRQLRERHAYDDEEEYDEELGEPSIFERLRETAAERLGTLASEVSHRMMRGT